MVVMETLPSDFLSFFMIILFFLFPFISVFLKKINFSRLMNPFLAVAGVSTLVAAGASREGTLQQARKVTPF